MEQAHWLTPEEMEALNYNEAEFANPVFSCEGKWYFSDETWAQAHGPHNSREEAQQELDQYASTL